MYTFHLLNRFLKFILILLVVVFECLVSKASRQVGLAKSFIMEILALLKLCVRRGTSVQQK